MQADVNRECSPPPIHHQVGDYLLLQLLGHGGMGSVFLAEHVGSHRRVAIKVIAPHLAQVPSLAARFEAEARAVMRIDHPNVIRIEGFGAMEDGTLYHVLELLNGVELNEVLRSRGKLTPAETLPYIKQICAGLQAAHDRRIVHRDLKPENIFVLDGHPLTVKLLDFGIAKLLDLSALADLTATGVVMGSPMFMAPEQAAGTKTGIGTHTDIYSLGVILYLMLTGAPPFECDNIESMLFNHLRMQPIDIRERDLLIPESVAQVVHRCLDKKPKNRPHSAREVARELETAVDQEADTRFHSVPGMATGPGVAVAVQFDEDELEQTLTDDIPMLFPESVPPEMAGDADDSPHRIPALGEVDPSVISVVEQPKRSWTAAHWLALMMGACGIGTIVVLIFTAVDLIR